MIRRGWRMASTRSMGKKSSSSRTRGWACGPAATAFRIEDSMTTQTQELGKFSLGVGDRFAHQAKAQLQACMLAAQAGVEVIPVWNKSNREHNIIGSEPASTRAAADAAEEAVLLRRRPHQPDHGRSVPRLLRLLYHRCRRCHRQIGIAGRDRRF